MASMDRLSIFKSKHSNVECLLSANHRLAAQKEESILKINKKVVETFFDCALFLAKQGIAFRRDPQENGKLMINVTSDLIKLFFLLQVILFS